MTKGRKGDVDEYEPEYCKGCGRKVTDGHGKSLCKHDWICGSGTYCKACFDAGKVVDTLTGKAWKWNG